MLNLLDASGYHLVVQIIHSSKVMARFIPKVTIVIECIYTKYSDIWKCVFVWYLIEYSKKPTFRLASLVDCSMNAMYNTENNPACKLSNPPEGTTCYDCCFTLSCDALDNCNDAPVFNPETTLDIAGISLIKAILCLFLLLHFYNILFQQCI